VLPTPVQGQPQHLKYQNRIKKISPSDVGRANLLVELLLLRSVVLTFSSSAFSLEELNSLVENVACY